MTTAQVSADHQHTDRVDRTAAATTTRFGRPALHAAVLLGGLGLVAGVVRERLSLDLDAGGDPWRQGDWLISGPVRRGLGGDTVFAIGDGFDLGPVGIVITVQAVLFATIFVSLFVAIARTRFDARAVLLAVAPLGLAFWAWDQHGIARKELFIYAGLGVLAAAPRSRFALITSSVLIGAGFLTHEAMLTFLPVWLLGLWLCARSGTERRWPLAALAISGTAALVGAALTFARAGDGDLQTVCAEVVGRDVGRHVCDGAMRHVDGSVERGRLFVSATIETGHTSLYPLLVVAALGTLFALRPVNLPAPRSALFIAALGLPFVPLAFVAVDWGRWLNFHFVGLLLLALIALNAGALDRRPPLRLSYFLLWLIVGLSWTVPHYIGAPVELGPLSQALWDLG